MYKMINPYHEAYPYNEPGDWDDSQDHNIVIDATNPDAVIIERQSTGTDWGYGTIEIESDGAYYYSRGASYEAIIANVGDIFGKLADGKITFPVDCFTIYMGTYTLYGNRSGKFLLDLTDLRESNPDEVAGPAPKPMSKGSKTINRSATKTLKAKVAASKKVLKPAAASVARGKVAARGAGDKKTAKPVLRVNL